MIARPALEVGGEAIILGTARLRAATGWMPRTKVQPDLRRTWAWLRTGDARISLEISAR